MGSQQRQLGGFWNESDATAGRRLIESRGSRRHRRRPGGDRNPRPDRRVCDHCLCRSVRCHCVPSVTCGTEDACQPTPSRARQTAGAATDRPGTRRPSRCPATSWHEDQHRRANSPRRQTRTISPLRRQNGAPPKPHTPGSHGRPAEKRDPKGWRREKTQGRYGPQYSAKLNNATTARSGAVSSLSVIRCGAHIWMFCGSHRMTP